MNKPWTKRFAVASLLAAAFTPGSAYGVDFFWSGTAQTFDWFARETPNGPPGFSPWTLSGGGISGEAPDDAADRAFLSLAGKTTTLGTSVTVGLVTIGGPATLQINSGVLTTVNGTVLQAFDAELAFTGGAVNNSTGGLTSVGIIRGLSGTGSLTGDVTTSGQVIIGNAAQINFGGNNADFTQTAGSFNVVAGGTANFSASGYTFNADGGTIDIDGTMSFANAATFNLDGAAINTTGDLRINSGGAFNHISGAMTGEVTLAGGALNLLTPLTTSPAALGTPSFLLTGNGALTGNIHAAATVKVDTPTGNVIVDGGGTTIENRGSVILSSNNLSRYSAINFQSGGGLDNNGGTIHAMANAGGSTDRRLTSSLASALLTNRDGGQLLVDAGIELSLSMDVINTADITIGTSSAIFANSGVLFEMNSGTLSNGGRLVFNGSSNPAVFRYAGGTVTGNAIEFDNASLELVSGTSPVDFHFTNGTINQMSGDLLAGQSVIVDAATSRTSVSHGSGFTTDNSFTSAGTLRLTGADNNDNPTFFVPGSPSVFTNTGLIHAQGVFGSANLRILTGSTGAQLTNTGQIAIDPDTTLQLGLAVTNTGDVTIGTGATLDMKTLSNSGNFTHNAGTIANNGRWIIDNGSFTFNGGTITGNAIELEGMVLTLGATSGPASFTMQRGQLASNIRPGQTIEIQNNLTSIQITDTPGPITNDGTLILGGTGGGNGANIFRIGGLFQNLELTNHGTFIARNDNATQLGGFRTLNGELNNFGTATVEPGATYSATATINRNQFTVLPGGTVSVIGGRSFTQQAGTLTNNGTFDLNGGIFNYNGGEVTGNTIIADGTLIFGPGLTGGGDFVMNNNGAFGGEVPEQATVRFVGPATNAWVVNAGAAPGDITNHGLIVLDHSLGGFVDLRTLGTHTIEESGELQGDGRISFQVGPTTLINRGTIAPGGVAGDETGLIRVSGNFTQQATGTLIFQLGGTADSDYDRLNAASALNLDGILDLELVPGYTPTLGDSFTILTGTSRNGVFDSAAVQQLAVGLAGEVSYTSNSVIVDIIAAATPGDTDGDNDVDDSDLGTSFANYTGPIGAAGAKTLAQGDTDGDGDVDDSDLGTSFAGYTGPLAPASVPEPASLALIVFSGLLVTGRRHHARATP